MEPDPVAPAHPPSHPQTGPTLGASPRRAPPRATRGLPLALALVGRVRAPRARETNPFTVRRLRPSRPLRPVAGTRLRAERPRRAA